MTNKKIRITNKQKDIIRRLRAENYSYTTIGKVMGLNPNTVKSICFRKEMAAADIPRKTKQEKAALQICKQCGKVIDNPWNRIGKQFCSDRCRRTYWNAHRGIERLQKDAGLPAPSEVSLDGRR